MKKPKKLIPALIAVVAIVAIAVVSVFFLIPNEEGSLTTVTKSSLQEVLEISELSTIEYNYNAVAKKFGNKKGEILYYVSYNGLVTAGIDLQDVTFEIIDGNQSVTSVSKNISTTAPLKKVIITVPPVKILDTSVEMESLEYIFIDKKSETETVSEEAYKLCKQDLKNRVNSENILFETAQENAVSAIEALFRPWIEDIDPEFEIEIR